MSGTTVDARFEKDFRNESRFAYVTLFTPLSHCMGLFQRRVLALRKVKSLAKVIDGSGIRK